MRILPALGLVLVLPGCATITEGTSQNISVITTPPGANCYVDRAGTKLGIINPTPGSLHIDKSKNDLSIRCKRVGYQKAIVTTSAKFNGATFGNILAGGLVGVVVDAATGANYNYPSEIDIPLAPISPHAVSPPAQAPLVGASKPVS